MELVNIIFKEKIKNKNDKNRYKMYRKDRFGFLKLYKTKTLYFLDSNLSISTIERLNIKFLSNNYCFWLKISDDKS